MRDVTQVGCHRFGGKSALVTGAGAGIGAAIARRLAAEGAFVGVLDRDGESATAVVDELERSGGRGLALAGDVRDRTTVEQAVATLHAAAGGLDVLVSNAGVARHGRLEELPDADWQFVMDVNLHAQRRLVAAVAPLMRSQGGGAIVLTSSVHAHATSPLLAAYAASKGAIVALARALALDYGPDAIRVNVVAPGSVDTPMLRASARLRNPESPDAVIAEWGARHPIGRILRPAEVAAAVAFLASDDASGITGICQPVDGGLLARLSL